MAKRWTLARAKQLFEDRGCLLLEEVYVSTKADMRYVAVCGHEHQISLENFKAGKGDLCRSCRYKSNGRKEGLGNAVIRRAFEDEGFTVLSDDVYRTTDKVRYIASCGHENRIDYSHFMSGGGRVCAKCSHSVLYDYDTVKDAFASQGCELLSKEYINCKTPLRYINREGRNAIISFDAFLNASHKNVDDDPRHSLDYILWRGSVFSRDGYACVACGRRGAKLNAHHKNAFKSFPELRFDVSNGATLCERCHRAYHGTFGSGKNTEEEFNIWLQVIPRKAAAQ